MRRKYTLQERFLQKVRYNFEEESKTVSWDEAILLENYPRTRNILCEVGGWLEVRLVDLVACKNCSQSIAIHEIVARTPDATLRLAGYWHRIHEC